MEQLLHYTWQHRLFPTEGCRTTEGKKVEIIDPGLHNENAGPDFFNAKIRVEGTVWVGNVEIHTCSSDWNRHGHNRDEKYDNVILHVVEKADVDIFTSDGKKIPQLEISIPVYVRENYVNLLAEGRYPPCWRIIPELPPVVTRQWMDSLCVERLEQKMQRLDNYMSEDVGNWERAFFVTLARSFGFGINSDNFEEWALGIPLMACGKHRDNPFQIEAIFLGQAGLLDDSMILRYHLDQAMKEGYYLALKKEYEFLRKKFSMKPMNGSHWNFLRTRPQNFPHIRLVQLARLFCQGKVSLSSVIDLKSIEEAREILVTQVSPYWETHYTFGGESAPSQKMLRGKSVDLLIINAVVPALFAYGKHRMQEELCQKGFELLEQLKAEDNRYTRIWLETGLAVTTASDSQALLQLRTHYCDRKDCLRCRFGYYFLRRGQDRSRDISS